MSLSRKSGIDFREQKQGGSRPIFQRAEIQIFIPFETKANPVDSYLQGRNRTTLYQGEMLRFYVVVKSLELTDYEKENDLTLQNSFANVRVEALMKLSASETLISSRNQSSTTVGKPRISLTHEEPEVHQPKTPSSPDELDVLNSKFDSGAITEAEFVDERMKIMDKLSAAGRHIATADESPAIDSPARLPELPALVPISKLAEEEIKALQDVNAFSKYRVSRR
jgi:hypothetical protein